MIFAHIMGIYFHHVLAAIYVFVTIICKGLLVNSDHLEKQRISECHDKNGDCLAQRRNGEKNNVVLRLPRLQGVKVRDLYTYTTENNGNQLKIKMSLAELMSKSVPDYCS